MVGYFILVENVITRQGVKKMSDDLFDECVAGTLDKLATIPTVITRSEERVTK